MKCIWVNCGESLSNRVSNIIRRYIRRSCEVCCCYDCSIYHILSYSSGSIFSHCIYGCMFCMFLFNFVYYAFLLLFLCILIVMYVRFRIFCFILLLYVLFLCKCVLYYCHRVAPQLQLTNISSSLSSSSSSQI